MTTDKHDETIPTEAEQLAKMGLRKATQGEAGWYVKIRDRDDDGTFTYSLWVTDLPVGAPPPAQQTYSLADVSDVAAFVARSSAYVRAARAAAGANDHAETERHLRALRDAFANGLLAIDGLLPEPRR
jgi:hypothetical protein